MFDRALSPAPWTLPSLASVHTGLYPREHAAVGADTALSSEVTTLAEALKGAGYRTVGVVSNLFLTRRYGLGQGFDTFDESLVAGHEAVTSPDLTRAAISHIEKLTDGPYFLWVHYFDPHHSYVAHPQYAFADPAGPTRLTFEELQAAEPALNDSGIPDPFSVAQVQALYDEEIAFTDAAIGDLVRGIEALSSGGSTLFALTSDHGEYFMERGRFAHGRDVYDELIRVPLILWGTGVDEARKGGRISTTVEVAALARTFSGVAGLDGTIFDGVDLLGDEISSGVGVPSFSEGVYAWGTDQRKIMAEWKGQKLIRNLDDDRYELYDLSRDPAERQNLWGFVDHGPGSVSADLREALDRFAQRDSALAPTLELDREELQRLESLGYVK